MFRLRAGTRRQRIFYNQFFYQRYNGAFMTKKIFLSLMAVLGLLLSAHAQEREITGSVKDHAGAGIVSAPILDEGTTKGTTSGADGSFSRKDAPDNVQDVSCIG